MPSLPWTSRPDVSPAEDTSVEALLAGNSLPAGAEPELRPVADVLAALSASPAGDELTGLDAARAEFRRHVVRPAQRRESPARRPGGLASRLGVKAAAAAALVALAMGGAAAAAYARALPGSWQQLAHRTIGAPAYRAGHGRPLGTGAAGPSAPHPRHPAHQTDPGRPPARHRSKHAGPPHHAWPPAKRPFTPFAPFPHPSKPPAVHAAHHALIRPAHYALIPPARVKAVRPPLPERE
jgi:hypothetical protein